MMLSGTNRNRRKAIITLAATLLAISVLFAGSEKRCYLDMNSLKIQKRIYVYGICVFKKDKHSEISEFAEYCRVLEVEQWVRFRQHGNVAGGAENLAAVVGLIKMAQPSLLQGETCQIFQTAHRLFRDQIIRGNTSDSWHVILSESNIVQIFDAHGNTVSSFKIPQDRVVTLSSIAPIINCQ